MPAPIFLLTDFGNSDVYVGVMKAVIAGIADEAAVIDLGHEISPQDVRGAACALLFSYRYLPGGSVVCCVVDPGVGTTRDAVAVELATPNGPLHLVLPDNGLLTPLLDLVRRAVVLDDPEFRLPSPSATFHGRDIFAPAAAHIARGVPLERLGSGKEPGELATIEWPGVIHEGSEWRGQVIHVDRFGNLVTNLAGEVLQGDDWLVRFGGQLISGVSPTFAAVEVGEPVAYLGSSGYLELAIRQGNAAERWGAGRGDEVVLEARGGKGG